MGIEDGCATCACEGVSGLIRGDVRALSGGEVLIPQTAQYSLVDAQMRSAWVA